MEPALKYSSLSWMFSGSPSPRKSSHEIQLFVVTKQAFHDRTGQAGLDMTAGLGYFQAQGGIEMQANAGISRRPLVKSVQQLHRLPQPQGSADNQVLANPVDGLIDTGFNAVNYYGSRHLSPSAVHVQTSERCEDCQNTRG